MIKYIIYDKSSFEPLKEKEGFATKVEAKLQAQMDAKVENIKNFGIEVLDTNDYDVEMDHDLAQQVFVDTLEDPIDV